ncbi:glutamate racemase [Vulcanococcus sp.]|jgi:glutamate racemase|uniref:glutamate racemase n=1 Tax=Vulcanococcus sp. TaxID=2856995 RepID=UPI003C0765DC
MSGAPIGLFDSGVGGLSIWRQVVHALPSESLLYVADQANVPYGHRSADEIQANSLGIADYLVAQGCKAIVVACNTASAVALEPLRQRFPQLPILGLEPAVKPAVQLTRSGVVGVMATPATFQGQLYRATVGRYATAVQVVEQVCVGLAELVEQGDLEGPDCDARLMGYLQPMLDAGADTIVLGCTHYPFVIESIRRLVGPAMAVLDPAPAVARHLADVLRQAELLAMDSAGVLAPRFATTADPLAFNRALSRLVGVSSSSQALTWQLGPDQTRCLTPA